MSEKLITLLKKEIKLIDGIDVGCMPTSRFVKLCFRYLPKKIYQGVLSEGFDDPYKAFKELPHDDFDEKASELLCSYLDGEFGVGWDD